MSLSNVFAFSLLSQLHWICFHMSFVRIEHLSYAAVLEIQSTLGFDSIWRHELFLVGWFRKAAFLNDNPWVIMKGIFVFYSLKKKFFCLGAIFIENDRMAAIFRWESAEIGLRILTYLNRLSIEGIIVKVLATSSWAIGNSQPKTEKCLSFRSSHIQSATFTYIFCL